MALEDFLGRGWGFPPAFDTKGVGMTTGVEDIEKSLEILLSTRLRERIMLPEYGCNLDVFLFESINTSLRTQIKETVKDAIYYHEPRIDPLNVTLEQPPESLGSLFIVIEYRIRATNTRYNYVFPFYKEEATQLAIDPTLPNVVSNSFNN